MKRTTRFNCLLTTSLMATATSAGAEVISFDEMTATNSNCCYLTSEYLDLGVTFETTDDGSVWGGLSNGNPGTWGLEGTNGPAFLGFNGASYSATMLFDVPWVSSAPSKHTMRQPIAKLFAFELEHTGAR